jgi:hypothetical protein
VWEQSKPWRFENVEEAAQLTTTKGALGLQRVELLCSIGWSVGIPRSTVNITPRDIIERCSGPEQRLVMEVFLKWITQCHHLNQAQQFGTAMNFPIYNLDQDFIVDSLLRTLLDPPPAFSEGFRCEVLLPPLDVLIREDARELVAIRADLGSGYLFALRRWQNEPSLSNQESVQASLGAYCEQISIMYDESILQPMVARMARGSSALGTVAESVGNLGGVALPTSPFGLFSQLGGLVSTVYKYVRSQRLRSRLATRRQQLEVVLTSSGVAG